MSLYTERFFSDALYAERSALAVPPGRRWILRDLEAHSTAACHVILGVNAIYVIELAVEPNISGQWQGRVVAYAGEPIYIWSTPAGAHATLTGYSFIEGTRTGAVSPSRSGA